MKSSIRFSKNGNQIRMTGKAANDFFKSPTRSPDLKGQKFFSQSRKQEMMLVQDDSSEWNGWLVYKHPDGQWVSLRKATDADISELANAISEAHHLA